MGRGTVRAGAPTTGTQAADGTDNDQTAPRILLFDPPVRPCIVTNHCVNEEVRVKINTELNGTVSETFTTANGLGHFLLSPRVATGVGGVHTVDVSCGGQVAVHSVSFTTGNGSDDLDDVSVVGFQP